MSAMSRRLLEQNGGNVRGVVVAESKEAGIPEAKRPALTTTRARPATASSSSPSSFFASTPSSASSTTTPSTSSSLSSTTSAAATQTSTPRPLTSAVETTPERKSPQATSLQRHGTFRPPSLREQVLALKTALIAQLTTLGGNWEPQAAASFTSTIVNILRKQTLSSLLTSPEDHGVPARLLPFIGDYLNIHPELPTAIQANPAQAKQIEGELVTGRYELRMEG